MTKTIEMLGIFIPESDEKWFNSLFSDHKRAIWFATSEGLEKGDYEIKPVKEIKIPA